MLRPHRPVGHPAGALRLRLELAGGRPRHDGARARLRVAHRGSATTPPSLAQKIATLAEMFPGRFWTALGSGEASNEHITGDRWPPKEERTRRLEECVDVIRRLLAGEEVTHDGLVTVDRARVWDLPQVQPRLIAPAVSVASAARVARWADGLVTINQPVDVLRDLVAAYRDAGGAGAVVAPGAPVVGADARRGRGDRARPVAHQRLHRAGQLGHRDPGGVRRDGRARRHRRRTTRGGGVRATSGGTGTGSPSSRPSASTTSTCTSWGRSRQASSTRSASTSCRALRG